MAALSSLVGVGVTLDELESVGSFITLSKDFETGVWTLDIGDVDYYEARGAVTGALREIEDRCPEIRFRQFGSAIMDDDGDSEDTLT